MGMDRADVAMDSYPRYQSMPRRCSSQIARASLDSRLCLEEPTRRKYYFGTPKGLAWYPQRISFKASGNSLLYKKRR